MTARLNRRYSAWGIEFWLETPVPVEDWTAELGEDPAAELARYLLQLLEEGHVEEVDATLRLPWPALYRLSKDEDHISSLAVLELPPGTTHVPALESRGGLSDAEFAIFVSGWRTKEGNPLRGVPAINGAVLRTGQEDALVSEEVWRLLEELRQFSALAPAERTSQENRRRWGRIRELMLDAEAYRSTFLDQTVVLTPRELKLRLNRVQLDNESVVVVEPSFEGAPANWLSTFDTWKDVRDRYDLPQVGGRLVHVMIEPKVKTVLREIKAMPARRVAGRRAEAFIRNPFALLGEDAADVLTEENFERARAEGDIGFSTASFRPTYENGWICGVEMLISTAIAEEVRSAHEPIATADELARLVEEMGRKLRAGRLAFHWRGFEIDITGDTPSQLHELEALLAVWREPQGQISYAEVFDLTRYSARVDGIGIEKPYYSPYIARKSDQSSWIPENMDWGISWTPSGQHEPVHLPLGGDGLEALEAAIAKAKAQNAPTVDVRGCPAAVPLHEAEEIAQDLKRALGKAKAGSFDPKTDAANRRIPRPSLVLKPNIATLDYEETRRELAFERTTAPRIPKALKAEVQLKAHQEEGIAWLQHLWARSPEDARGCLLADDMGLGKTLQLLTFIVSCFEVDDTLEPALVVAPVSLLENWSQEIKKFLAPDALKVLSLYSGTVKAFRADRGTIDPELQRAGITQLLRPGWRGNANLVLTTYETLRDLEFSLAAERWSIMICDEAQRIKNPSAMVTRAAKKLQVRFKVACTGTPVENTLADLWCLFDFFQPGYLGPLNEFGRKYRRPIEAETDDQRKAIAELQALIEPQTLRRLKREVAKDLPPKRNDDACTQLAMSQTQRKLYAQAIHAFKGSLSDSAVGEKSKTAHLGLLSRLRGICADPRPFGILPSANEPLREAEERSPKLRWLMGALRGIRDRGEKAIVFTDLREIQRMLQGYIEQAFGIRAPIINGDTTTTVSQVSSRQAIIDRYQKSAGFGVLILSPLAVGFGVNIQAANHVIHYTRTWNPAKEDQATDRAYRIGQTKDVYVYTPTIVAPDFVTFEAKLDRLLAFKRGLSTNMLDGTAEVNAAEFLDLGGPGGEQVYQDSHIEESHLHDFDPRAFEAFCQLLWQKMGYKTRRTGRSGDHGVDVVAWRDGEAVLIQCKTSKNPGHRLGWDAVRDVAAGTAAYAAQYEGYAIRKVAVTNQYFNEDAVRQADLLQVSLYTQVELISLMQAHRPTQRELMGFLNLH